MIPLQYFLPSNPTFPSNSYPSAVFPCVSAALVGTATILVAHTPLSLLALECWLVSLFLLCLLILTSPSEVGGAFNPLWSSVRVSVLQRVEADDSFVVSPLARLYSLVPLSCPSASDAAGRTSFSFRCRPDAVCSLVPFLMVFPQLVLFISSLPVCSSFSAHILLLLFTAELYKSSRNVVVFPFPELTIFYPTASGRSLQITRSRTV